jgi:hypothetical protein
MRINLKKITAMTIILSLILTLTVSCGGEISTTDDADTVTESSESQSIMPRVDNQEPEVEVFDRSILPELDPFTLPKVTQTTIELAYTYLPRSLAEVDPELGLQILSFTNFKHGFKRMGINLESPSEEDLSVVMMYSPDFLASRIFSVRQPIDEPKNWGWMAHDRLTGGVWFAGDLSMGEKLLPAMRDDEYTTEPLVNSMMTSFHAPRSNQSPIYGRQVAPFSPNFGYFNHTGNNVEQADETAVLVRQNDVFGLSENQAIIDILRFVGDTENAVLIKSDITLENAVKGLGVPAEMASGITPVLKKLEGYGRRKSLDWFAFSHNPSDEFPIRIILRYETNEQAQIDMKLFKYVHDEEMVEFDDRMMDPSGVKIEMKRFSVYENIGLVECNITGDLELPGSQFGQRISDIRLADKLTDLFISGMFPLLLLNN